MILFIRIRILAVAGLEPKAVIPSALPFFVYVFYNLVVIKFLVRAFPTVDDLAEEVYSRTMPGCNCGGTIDVAHCAAEYILIL